MTTRLYPFSLANCLVALHFCCFLYITCSDSGNSSSSRFRISVFRTSGWCGCDPHYGGFCSSTCCTGSFLSSLLSASVTTLSSPFMWVLVMPNSSRSSIQRITLSEAFSVVSCTRLRWSVKTLILYPSNMPLNSFRVSTIPKSSFSSIV